VPVTGAALSAPGVLERDLVVVVAAAVGQVQVGRPEQDLGVVGVEGQGVRVGQPSLVDAPERRQ
jgi:hypothetical protein